MKKIIKLSLKDQKYNIIIEKNSILKNIQNEIKYNQKIFILIDTKVSHLINKLKLNSNINIIKISCGEKIKTIEYYKKIYSKLLNLNIDRSSTIISIGGGSLGDLSGFVASTVLRGVKFVLIPTTLLSQVDSSIGGKNGINTNKGKNLIGTFLQPSKVIIDIVALKSLPTRELKSGYAEILKHSLINDKNFFLWLDKNYDKVLRLQNEFISKAIIESVKIKIQFVKNDEQERLINKNSRAMLNFGHTFGHALETMNYYNKKLTHGEAISIGMAFASKISHKMKFINHKDFNFIVNHLKKVKLPYYDGRIKNNKIYDLMLNDKKNSNNKINLILLETIGTAFFKRGFSKEKIKKLLN